MSVRYINVTDKTNEKPAPVVSPPPAPAPQQPAAAPINRAAIAARKQALQAELDATEQAERDRLNAEANAARKQQAIASEIAALEAAERASAVSELAASAQRIAAGNSQNVANLYSELNTISEAIENITYTVNLKASFGHFVDVAQQAVAHAMPTDFNYDVARRQGGSVLSQLGQPPVDLIPALKAWIKFARNEQEEQIRVGLSLAICGKLLNPRDIPAGYDPKQESAEIVRVLAMPG